MKNSVSCSYSITEKSSKMALLWHYSRAENGTNFFTQSLEKMYLYFFLILSQLWKGFNDTLWWVLTSNSLTSYQRS